MKTHIFFFAFFMSVLSTYGQIEQFGSRALSGRTSSQKSSAFYELNETLSSFTGIGDTITPSVTKTIGKNADLLAFMQEKIAKERKQLDSLTKDNELLNTKKEKAKDAEVKSNITAQIKKNTQSINEFKIRIEESDTIIKKLNKENLNFEAKYFNVYKQLIKEKQSALNSKFDTLVIWINKTSPIMNSITIDDLAELEEDDAFKKDDFAKKLFKLRWKLGEINKQNTVAKKALSYIEHDLDKNLSEKGLDSMGKKLDSIQVTLNNGHNFFIELVELTQKYSSQKDKNRNGQFQLGAQPDVLTNFAGSNVLNVVPNIDIIGSYYYDDGTNGVSANVRLFSGYANTDSSIHRNASSFWLPEASLFGISFDVLAVFVPAKKDLQKNLATKRIGFRFSPSFLIKNTPERNASGEFTGTGNGVGVVHVRTGLEYYPIKFLVLYANFNCVTPISQVQTFRNFYGTTKSLYPFFDFGFRTPIIISNKENKNTTINIDVNFIGISGDMKAVYPTNDVIIPSIRLGIVQRFNTGD